MTNEKGIVKSCESCGDNKCKDEGKNTSFCGYWQPKPEVKQEVKDRGECNMSCKSPKPTADKERVEPKRGSCEVGVQPCDNFKPEMTGEHEDAHQCPECLGVRKFCLNCHSDHHENGWESCTCDCEICKEARKQSADKVEITLNNSFTPSNVRCSKCGKNTYYVGDMPVGGWAKGTEPYCTCVADKAEQEHDNKIRQEERDRIVGIIHLEKNKEEPTAENMERRYILATLIQKIQEDKTNGTGK